MPCRYVVLDIEPVRGYQNQGRWVLAEVQVAKESDFGRNDKVYFAKTHLGHLLSPGDWVLSGVMKCMSQNMKRPPSPCFSPPRYKYTNSSARERIVMPLTSVPVQETWPWDMTWPMRS